MASIMIVDDEEQIARLLIQLLATMGHRGIYMPNGQAAVAYLKTRSPDLVILDVMMPDLDGTGVLRFIRHEMRPTLPVVIYSAVSDPAFRAYVLGLGANEYWVKAGIDVDEIGRGIERLVRPVA